MKAQKVNKVIRVGKISKKDLELLTQAGYAVIVGASNPVDVNLKKHRHQLRLLKS
mgnify:CR=1 FL=1